MLCRSSTRGAGPLARRAARVAGIAVVLALTACVSKPDSGTARPKEIGGYATAHSFAVEEGSTAAWPQDRWWERYGDAQLDQLVGDALDGAPTLAAAAARLRNAEATVQQSHAALFPDLSAQAKVDKEKQSYHYLTPPAFTPKGWRPAGQASLDFSYELDFWGKNRAALAAATSEAEAAQADAAQSRLVLSTSVVDAYADLARLYAERDCASAALDVRMKTAALFVDRKAEGLETEGAVQQAIERRDSSQADVLSIDESIALTRNRIAALIGAGPDRALSMTRPSVAIDQRFGLPRDVTLQLLARRPDIVVARLRAQAAAKRIDVAAAQFYPDVSLSAVIGMQSLGLNLLTKSGSLFGNVGPAISLPIFNAGRLRGQYRGAQATYDEAVANYDDTLVKALHDVADAAVSDRALQPRIDATKAAWVAAARARDSIKARYEGGLASYLDVLSSEDSLIDAQRQLADIQSRAFTLDVALARALGGGFNADANPAHSS
ncbi:efflux transporter outer membrane subunit [Trinickia sp.]|uniref:efflux transporter outer membrane subunit n=1 Tax=Trinickia sp. TaxID=2571163 RepID=UPI003F7E1E3B